jgi:acetyl esterase/lipase
MSWQMRGLAALARLLRRPRTYATAESARSFLARPKGSGDPPSWLAASGRRLGQSQLGGFTCYTVESDSSQTGAETGAETGSIVYVHGGGYVSEIQRVHWKLVADLADATRRPVHVPLYGLGPAHCADEAIEFLHAVLTRAAADGPTYLAGDSSGGGLALAAAQNWIAAGGLPPVGLTLISPWLDIALTNPAIAALESRDPWLSVAGLRECGKVWAADLPPDDNRVSPIHGDLTNLPHIDLYVGDRDILAADCRRLRDEIGPRLLDYHERAGAIHVYPLLPVPEAAADRRMLISRVATVLADQSAS